MSTKTHKYVLGCAIRSPCWALLRPLNAACLAGNSCRCKRHMGTTANSAGIYRHARSSCLHRFSLATYTRTHHVCFLLGLLLRKLALMDTEDTQ